MHGCTDFGQKKQLSAPLPPPPQLLSNFVFFRNGHTSDDQICSLLLMFVNRKVTKGDIIHLLILSSSLSLLFFTILVTWRCVTLWVRMCSPEPDLSLVRDRKKRLLFSKSTYLEIIQHTSKSDHFPLWNMVNGCDLLQLVMFFLYSAEWPSVIFLKRFSISITFHLLLLACYCIIFLYNSHKFSFIVSVCVHVFREEEQAKQQRQRFSISECIIHISWCHVGSTFTYLGWLGW